MSNIRIAAHTIGSNQIEIHHGDNRYLISYKTPVAAYISGQGFFRSSTKWSRTTSKHINKWLEGVTAKEIPQQIIEDWIGWGA